MIAEYQTTVRQALVALPELESDIEVAAEAANGDEELAMARKHEPDVVVLDIEMPGPSGIEVASLSPGTVRNHLSAAIQKLGARNGAEAVEIAQRKGWL
jgi:DNA-binding NarL/FixJ family response regulator